MEIIYKKTQSNEKPATIDVVSSPECVYIRRDIKAVEYETESGGKRTRFEYNEAILSKNDYEEYKNILVANEVNSNENSTAFENYQKKLATGVEYKNGHKYKPKYIDDYKRIMEDVKNATDLIKDLNGDASQILSQKFAIYDETGTVENMVLMSGLEVIELYFFLYAKKEEYFAEYKLEKEML